jgi:DNA-binding transcriptional ArsR family regulator
VNMSASHNILSPEILEKAAECLKILAHPARLQLLQHLRNGERELRVGELAELCNMKQNVASEHLRLMQRCNFLQSRKDGTQVFYYISESHILEILDCIERKFNGGFN